MAWQKSIYTPRKSRLFMHGWIVVEQWNDNAHFVFSYISGGRPQMRTIPDPMKPIRNNQQNLHTQKKASAYM